MTTPATHTCHAHGCTLDVPPRKFVCRFHWRSLSVRMRRAILREYVKGQEQTKTPTLRYLAVQRLAIAKLAIRQIHGETTNPADAYLAAAQKFREAAIAAGQGDPLEGLVPA